MEPTVGRIVHYRLSKRDAEQINRRRTDGASIAKRITAEKWPVGAQAHIGNTVREGDSLPLLIVAINSVTSINGQVFLDGNDTFWAISVSEGPEAGQWSWPEIKRN